jgi:hypothetical protein
MDVQKTDIIHGRYRRDTQVAWRQIPWVLRGLVRCRGTLNEVAPGRPLDSAAA